MNEEQYTEIRERLASNEQEHKSFRRRLDEHDERLKKLGDILVAIERQGNALERIGRALDRVEITVDSVDKRVDALEKEPGEKWKKITWEILKYVMLALIGGAVGWAIKSAV